MPIESLTRLKILLLEQPEPQYKIAAACGMHPSVLSSYALGQKPIARKHLKALTTYFDCTQQDIIGWEDIEW